MKACIIGWDSVCWCVQGFFFLRWQSTILDGVKKGFREKEGSSGFKDWRKGWGEKVLHTHINTHVGGQEEKNTLMVSETSMVCLHDRGKQPWLHWRERWIILENHVASLEEGTGTGDPENQVIVVTWDVTGAGEPTKFSEQKSDIMEIVDNLHI